MRKKAKKCFCILLTLNSLPHDKVLNLSKLKRLADNKIDVTENLKYLLGRVKLWEKKKTVSYTGSLKVLIVWWRVKTIVRNSGTKSNKVVSTNDSKYLFKISKQIDWGF